MYEFLRNLITWVVSWVVRLAKCVARKFGWTLIPRDLVEQYYSAYNKVYQLVGHVAVLEDQVCTMRGELERRRKLEEANDRAFRLIKQSRDNMKTLAASYQDELSDLRSKVRDLERVLDMHHTSYVQDRDIDD